MLTFNIVANILLLYFTVVLLRYSKQLLQNAVGKSVLLLVSVFYIVRIFAEFYFWGFRGVPSTVIIVLCAIPAVCCMVPLFKSPGVSYAG
jgi:ABC-type amino acid transport system permease subunit